MTEFYHNLSMLTLNISNDSVQMNFDSIKNLVKNINILIQYKIFKFKKLKRPDNEIINNDINNYKYKLIKTPIEKVEESIAQSISNDKKTFQMILKSQMHWQKTIRNEFEKEEEYFLEISLPIGSEEFKNFKSNEEEKKKKII